MRKLYYSEGSPYARKVRIVLAEKGLDFEGDQSHTGMSAEEHAAINPNLQVPIFEDGDLRLFESNLILEYLLKTYPGAAPGTAEPPLAGSLTRPDHHWEDAKILATLETLATSMVNLRQLEISGVKAEEVRYLQRQHARIQNGLDWLESRATPEGFAPGLFSIMDMNLLCALEFSEARDDIFPWRGHQRLEAIVARYAHRPSVQSTRPGPPPPAS